MRAFRSSNTGRWLILVLFGAAIRTVPATASKKDEGVKAIITGQVSAYDRAHALLEISNSTQDTRPGESLEKARTALVFAEEAGELPLIHEVQRRIRDLEHRFGAQDNFLHSAITAMRTAQRMGDERAMAEDLAEIALAYRGMGQTHRAIEEGTRSLLLYQRLGDTLAIAHTRIRLVSDLAAAGQVKEALEMGRTAQHLMEGLKDEQGQAESWLVLGEILADQGRYGDALPCLAKARIYLDRSGEPTLRARTLLGLIACDIRSGLLKEAEADLAIVKELIGAQDLRVHRPRYLELLSRFDEAQGDLTGALGALRNAMSLKDSLMDAQVARRMAGLQALYLLNNKERDNTLLRRQNAMNEAIIEAERRRNRGMWIALTVLVATLMILGLAAYSKWRTLRRIRLKNAIIRRQSDEIHAKNLELQRQNARLEESMISEEEKDLLLREIHHRVKNDLQIVNALMRLQTAFLNDPQVDRAMEDCQRRVGTMALVHDQLYRSHDLQHVGLRDHLHSVALNVLKAFSLEERVHLVMDVEIESLPVEELVPLGLILNELLTNTAKHTFANTKGGRINVALRGDGTDGHIFTYADEGGWSDEDRSYQSGTFGFELMQALAGQMNGRITVLRGERTVFELHFGPKDEALRAAS
ncbi:MAG: sensor histidine kinase [Flavobacteriales bacterium]|nr:sensor histidine kinase [Flavobacteriales bacterium]MCB9168174.1 sensor histidine kinase [Flavobacteriales bacterium]MCB9194261.1 sensor histidine kinase [Flavobacteriales bacterium]